ncbi:hypothetical protein LCGC14_1932820, partial [marine sediment metagenome]
MQNIVQSDLCRSFEKQGSESVDISSSESVGLISGNYKLNLKEKTILMRQKKEEDEIPIRQLNTSDISNSCSNKYDFDTNIKNPQPSNNFSTRNSVKNIGKKTTNPDNEIVQTIESQKVLKVSFKSTPQVYNSLTPRKSINYDEYLKITHERDDLVVGISLDKFKIFMKKNDML